VNYYVLGGMAALLSAVSWALGGVLWRKIGEEISPFSMNLCKVVIGSLYLIIVLLVVGVEPMTMRDSIFLGVSGLVGITFGDTFFFMSLMYLGPRLASLMGTLTPVFIAIAAVLFLGERPSLLVWIGIIITVIGVIWVLWERLPENIMIKDKSLGIKYSLMSIVCTTVGVILAKIGVASVSAIQATFTRLVWGAIGLIAWGMFRRQLTEWVAPFSNFHVVKRVSFIVFIVVFGGFWLSLVSLKYIDASISSTLNATTPIFILPMVAIMLKEKIPARATLGAILAVGGVALIFMAK